MKICFNSTVNLNNRLATIIVASVLFDEQIKHVKVNTIRLYKEILELIQVLYVRCINMQRMGNS